MALTSLRTNPKFKRLVRCLSLPPPYVIGLLETMWHVGYESGNSAIGGPEDVELAAEWPGKPGDFFAAVKTDWLDLKDGIYHIHDLYDHAPEYVKKRLRRRNDNNLRKKPADTGGRPADTGGLHIRPNQSNPTYPTEPDQSVGDDRSSFVAIVDEFMLESYLNPRNRAAIERIARYGLEPARQAFHRARAAGISGPGMIAWAEKSVAGENSKQALRNNSGHRAGSGKAVRVDC